MLKPVCSKHEPFQVKILFIYKSMKTYTKFNRMQLKNIIACRHQLLVFRCRKWLTLFLRSSDRNRSNLLDSETLNIREVDFHNIGIILNQLHTLRIINRVYNDILQFRKTLQKDVLRKSVNRLNPTINSNIFHTQTKSISIRFQ